MIDAQAANDNSAVMPWPWELCLHCMDLSTGTILHWPVAGGWLENFEILRCMKSVWKAWKFAATSAADWTPADLAYKEWLDAGKPQKQSKFEAWLEDTHGPQTETGA